MAETRTSPAPSSATAAPQPDAAAAAPAPRPSKVPKTERGRRTLRALLNAAAEEFGEKGFHDAAISQITARAGVATGSFYVYFDSKEAIFQALVRDLSGQVKDFVGPIIAAAPNQLAAESAGQLAYLNFVRQHKEIYRIIDESEFVDPAAYREHYTNSAARIAARLEAAAQRGEISAGDSEVRAWAIMGMNVFLGLRFGVWGDEAPEAVVQEAGRLLAHGLSSPSASGEERA
ncbi:MULTISPECIES: TetR/AcrR family transcriptional regulator [unclassified Novosphingobium]|uniref:TetR/AcrR family transcriptional regulator n=1 Tax=unclassified Novosphingobium TaxID=2644732 RepID=UPI000D31D021|nr:MULTISPECIES: TetR/AcrR family transcriptional regulator [unclassified Novosphingobium]PTR13146.1 TetR family transcriptional regulator [Novosphingobium sp. GV055]PUB07365.1 TetR family transcriptional regulator [Novosphingobium sp. GV061]PUB23178.1 TetR family transcriptional regulator [Novosphingobium sp. GV079]PUB44942.1 TetR family transcriptional regulator [Novosphingobium sp. GV027]